MGTLLAIRAARLCEAAHMDKAPWVVENPEELEQHTSLVNLAEWVRVCSMDGVRRQPVAHCCFGADHLKRTAL